MNYSGTHNSTGNRSKQRGFTLLEALISLVILSIGMLGVAGLFFEGLKSSRTAVYRTTAIYLASDMADRIRANPEASAEYAKAGASSGCVSTTKTCSRAEMAADDIFLWKKEVTSQMPGGTTATITYTAGTPTDTYVISLAWAEPGFPDGLNYDLIMELRN